MNTLKTLMNFPTNEITKEVARKRSVTDPHSPRCGKVEQWAEIARNIPLSKKCKEDSEQTLVAPWNLIGWAFLELRTLHFSPHEHSVNLNHTSEFSVPLTFLRGFLNVVLLDAGRRNSQQDQPVATMWHLKRKHSELSIPLCKSGQWSMEADAEINATWPPLLCTHLAF